MYFDRFDIICAWYLALCHCHGGQWSAEYVRLCKMQTYFKPGCLLEIGTLNENSRAIYEQACAKILRRYSNVSI